MIEFCCYLNIKIFKKKSYNLIVLYYRSICSSCYYNYIIFNVNFKSNIQKFYLNKKTNNQLN